MEEKEGLTSVGVTVRGDEAPRSFRVEPRAENSGQFNGPTAPGSAAAATSEMKKKRGRPRKYAGDGAIVALSPTPISSSIPLTNDFASWKHNSASLKKKHKFEFGKGNTVNGSGNFIPHMITVNTGEDIMMKIISFSQQGSRAICILAANGSISNVTLRQPNSSGGTLTYEGRFEILSLVGSFMPSDNGVTKSRSGGMSVSLAGPDGRVLGGGLAGMMVAAGPVQVVIGSFIPGIEHEQRKTKKPKYGNTITFVPSPANPVTEKGFEAGPLPNPTLTTAASFHGNNLATVISNHGSKTTDIENNTHFPGENPMEPNHEITC